MPISELRWRNWEEVLAEKLGGVVKETGSHRQFLWIVVGVTGEIGFGAIGDIGGLPEVAVAVGGGGGTGELSGIPAGGTGGLYSLLSGKGATCKLSWLPFI